MNIATLDYTILVVGGVGTALVNAQKVTLDFPCEIRRISIKAPAPTATYTVRLEDSAEWVIYTESGITGDFPILLNAVSNKGLVFKLSGATDGTYTARVWLKS